MSLVTRILGSKTLTAPEKLVLGLLANESMTAKQIVDCLMSDPYDLTFNEVCVALKSLIDKELIVLDRIKAYTNFTVDLYLTFATEWVLKI